VLNNDTRVPKKWLKQLIRCYETLLKDPDRPAPEPAIVAPCSNYVMSHQLVKADSPIPLDALDEFAERVHAENIGKWIYAGVVSGFCFMIRRDIWEKLGGFDERFVNGNEDVDLCARVNQMGYSCFVDRSTFVFHHGSKSLQDSMDSGTYNRLQVVEKCCGEFKERSISGNTRVKCSREQLEAWMKRHASLFDIINIVDDDSGWDMEGWLQENYPGKFTYTLMSDEVEVDQRAKLYEISFKQGVEWMVVLDHDEFLEEKVTREYLQRLANTPIPGVYAFVGRFIHLWNSPNTYHVNYPPASAVFMVKVLPNMKYFRGTPGTSLHCSRVPNIPAVSSAPVNVHILHYGYIDPDLREKKRRYYEALDPNPVVELVGGTDYSHLTNQNNILISEWQGSDKYTVSLNIMTEHEPSHKVQIFLESHATVADEIVVRVAPGSEAVDMLKRWGAKIFEREWTEDYSDMRNWLARKSTSAYIWVMDVDEMYSSPPEITFMVESHPTAAMFNVNNVQKNRPDVFTEVMRLYQNRPDIYFSGLIHETIEDSIGKIRNRQIIRAKGVINHFGFLTERLQDKLKYYIKLNKRAMHRDPRDPKPYFNLALHYSEMGDTKAAVEHLEKAVNLYSKFTLAKIELAKMYLRFSRALFESSAQDVPEGHPLYRPVNEVKNILRKLVPDETLMFPPFLTSATTTELTKKLRKTNKR